MMMMMMMMMSKVRIDPKEKSNVMYESAEESSEVRRGPWTLEEDNLLIHYITSHGEGRWNSLAKFAGLRRTGKSCRLRWLNYLKPDIKRGNLTPHEQLLILELHSKWGNRWSKIAQHLPGRTDNEIKNYWRTRVQKQARQLKVDSNSKKFVEAIRRFWMPRLMEKMEQNSSSSTTTTTSFETHENYDIMITNPPSPLSDHVPPPPTAAAAAGDSFVPHLEPQPEPTKLVQCENPLIDENSYYHVGFPSYDMQELVAQDISLPGCHVAGVDWFGDDLGSSTFWNTDELWQFRKSEEVGRVLL